jgi:hypothetical protein
MSQGKELDSQDGVMRKLIATVLLLGRAVLCAAINYPAAPYVLDAAQLEYVTELPESLQGDLSLAQNSEEAQLTITLSHQEFFYDKSISVSIQASNPEAGIYYTLDCSTPTIYSEIYTEPLEFAKLADLQKETDEDEYSEESAKNAVIDFINAEYPGFLSEEDVTASWAIFSRATSGRTAARTPRVRGNRELACWRRATTRKTAFTAATRWISAGRRLRRLSAFINSTGITAKPSTAPR